MGTPQHTSGWDSMLLLLSWGSIPSRRTKILQVTQHNQKKKEKTKLSIWVKSNHLNLKLKID